MERWSDAIRALAGSGEVNLDAVVGDIASDVAMGEQPGLFGWKSWLSRFLTSVIPLLVPLVETMKGPGNGAQKKAAVVDLIKRIYVDSGINIPVIPNIIEPWLVGFFAGQVIDLIVGRLNEGTTSLEDLG